MTVQTIREAIEMIRQAGSIRVENGKLRAEVPKAKDDRLKPALDYLRDHREER